MENLGSLSAGSEYNTGFCLITASNPYAERSQKVVVPFEEPQSHYFLFFIQISSFFQFTLRSRSFQCSVIESKTFFNAQSGDSVTNLW
jgi:hypothetical protein